MERTRRQRPAASRGAVSRHRGPGLHRRVDRPQPGPRGGARRRLRPGPGSAPHPPDHDRRGASAGITVRARRHHRARVRRAGAGRARDHEHHPPGGPPGAVLPGGPAARRPRQRAGHRQHLRGGPAAAGPHRQGRLHGLGRACSTRPTRIPGPIRLENDATAHPINHYGVYKQANEGTARVYWVENGVSSIGLRPMTVYGPGRDQGLTSSPTKAIVAAVLGRPATIGFCGRTLFQYADDVARTLLIAAAGASCAARTQFNLGGNLVDLRGLRGRDRCADPRRRATSSRSRARRCPSPRTSPTTRSPRSGRSRSRPSARASAARSSCSPGCATRAPWSPSSRASSGPGGGPVRSGLRTGPGRPGPGPRTGASDPWGPRAHPAGASARARCAGLGALARGPAGAAAARSSPA